MKALGCNDILLDLFTLGVDILGKGVGQVRAGHTPPGSKHMFFADAGDNVFCFPDQFAW